MSGSSTQKALLDLLDRPNEPIFFPKGEQATIFNVPTEYLEDRFKEPGFDMNRFGGGGGDTVPIKPITIPPSLNVATQLGKDELFSLFIPFHRKLAGRLIEVFVGAQSAEDLISMAAYCRGKRVNSALLNYALNVAMINRPDTKTIDIPPLCAYFPAKYVDGQIIRRAREEARLGENSPGGNEIAPLEIPLDYTASNLDPEHRVAYFREDLGINLHHWHWHLVYPFNGPANIIRKDRRGELFYYMHQQMVARYNFERFSNGLPRVTRLLDLRAPLQEGYFPKLDSISASRVWAARSPNTVLRDVNRAAEQVTFDILDLERWRNRLYEAVQAGRIIDSNGSTVNLSEETGIDILGNLIEASDLSMNKNIYGDLHNLGHVAIAYSHDPDFRHLETFGVMGDSATAMRDPIFYRWHAFIDDIFQDYKRTLRPYTTQELSFNGIQITGLEVVPEQGQRNTFNTFWQKSDVEMTRGMDFTPRSAVFARFTHLQHAPFSYRITIRNSGKNRRGTVRIFMAPRTDERGLPFLLNDQRILMIELDKFVVELQPNENTVTRNSTDSSVTIPFKDTFRSLETTATGAELAEFNYCGCGWPQHMLVPKGTTEGLDAVLFVMVSDYEQDRVEDQQRSNARCKGAISFCGVRDSKYPDKRPMGFPFDRQPIRNNQVVDTLTEFVGPISNMKIENVRISFSNRTAPPGSQGNQGGQSGNRLGGGGGGGGGGGQSKPNRPKSPNRRN